MPTESGDEAPELFSGDFPVLQIMIYEARLAQGLTQRELAWKIECHYQSIIKWELGKAVPSKKYQDVLVAVLQLDQELALEAYRLALQNRGPIVRQYNGRFYVVGTEGHCPQGHNLTDAYVRKNGQLRCRRCHADLVSASWRKANPDAPPGPSKRDHCIHGHLFDEANTYITSRGERQCRRCKADRERERQRQNRTTVKTSVCLAPDCGKPIPPGSRSDRMWCSLRCAENVRQRRYRSKRRD